MKKLGRDVETAYNGQECIDKVVQKQKCSSQCKKYKLIIMDCQMPIMDGCEATRNLVSKFQQRELEPIPIVGLTAFTSNADIERCEQAGMIAVLHKPLNLNKLRKVMQNFGIHEF